MNQSEPMAIACNLFKAREKSRAQGAAGFGFASASHWLKRWGEIFKPITKPRNRDRVMTFDSHFENCSKR